MALYQRRLASSAYALRHSLQNRARRLTENLKKARELAATAPPDLPDPEDLEEMEEAERERLEELLEAITIAQNPEQVREKWRVWNNWPSSAKALEEAEAEAKLGKFRTVLREQGFFDNPDERLLIFTEFSDTLEYLVEKLGKWGFRVGFIHGGMWIGSRDEKGSRLYVEQQFREARSRSWLPLRRPAKVSTCSAAMSCSITTFHGIPTGSNSGWGASIAMVNSTIA